MHYQSLLNSGQAKEKCSCAIKTYRRESVRLNENSRNQTMGKNDKSAEYDTQTLISVKRYGYISLPTVCLYRHLLQCEQQLWW